MSQLPAARAAYGSGLCPLPTKNNGSKAPDVPTWRAFQTTRPTPEQMRGFHFEARSGFGIVAGAVSQHRECWDFDTDEVFHAFTAAAHGCGLGALVDRLLAGYCDQTPGGGRRIIVTYPASVVWQDCTLARRPGREGEPPIKTLIELPTFAIVAPSNGQTHPSGKPYIRLSGGFDTISSYTADERDDLITLARTFDQMPRKTAQDRPSSTAIVSTGDRPGDDCNRRMTWPALLEPAGWTFKYERGGEAFWYRPGKTAGSHSATTNYHGSDLLVVFSSSTPFDTDVSYTKFGVYTLLHHGGDFKKAALALAKLGYGQQDDAPSASPPVVTVPLDWPEPAAIQSALPPVSAFSDALLPVSFRPLIRDVAIRMQVPIDYPAAAAILCLAGVVSRRAAIQPKAHDTAWQVIPNLWGGIVAPPGYMKSPVIQAITRPLHRIQDEWRGHHDVSAHDYGRRREEFDLRHAAWKEKYKASSKSQRPTPARPEDEPDEPTLQRLVVNDATFEALHRTMSENPAGVLLIRDELTGWLAQLDKPGREGERAFALESWNGDSGYTIDRIGRGTIHVPACCMSLLGGIQPGRLRSYLVDALKDGPSNDGLMQRFQVLVWPDTTPAWTYVDQAPETTSEDQVVRVFRRLVTLDVQQPARFVFSADAQDLFIAWLAELEHRIRTDELHPALVSHLSKYRKLMPALAVLFELADRAARSEFDGAALAQAVNHVTLEHAQQAAALCDYLESHATRVYSCVTTPQMRAARELAAKITARKVAARFSCREVYQNAWSGLDTPDLVKSAADLLIDAGWLRDAPVELAAAGGRPSTRFDVNPRVWA